MRNFRLLNVDEIECRIARTTDKGVQLLLYKTARTDYALLDECVGMDSWQNDYKEVDGKVYCGIGIRFDNEWIWKWNCGSESNMEAEKGEASDAMKRAGFSWGIGTELYSSPFIWIPNDKVTIVTQIDGKPVKPYTNDRFRVSNIAYDDKERICALDIDNTTKRCAAFTMGAKPSTTADKLRKQILELAEAKGIDKALVTDGEYKGKRWDELTDQELVAVKVTMAKR